MFSSYLTTLIFSLFVFHYCYCSNFLSLYFLSFFIIFSFSYLLRRNFWSLPPSSSLFLDSLCHISSPFPSFITDSFISFLRIFSFSFHFLLIHPFLSSPIPFSFPHDPLLHQLPSYSLSFHCLSYSFISFITFPCFYFHSFISFSSHFHPLLWLSIPFLPCVIFSHFSLPFLLFYLFLYFPLFLLLLSPYFILFPFFIPFLDSPFFSILIIFPHFIYCLAFHPCLHLPFLFLHSLPLSTLHRFTREHWPLTGGETEAAEAGQDSRRHQWSPLPASRAPRARARQYTTHHWAPREGRQGWVQMLLCLASIHLRCLLSYVYVRFLVFLDPVPKLIFSLSICHGPVWCFWSVCSLYIIKAAG